MTMQWFRLYHRIVDDEKLRLLAFEDRWHFVALCCLKGEGLLDTPDDSLRARKIAVKLGVQVRELEEIGRRLQEVGLVDETLSPVSWDELQYRSDSSAERVKRYREARKSRGLQAQWQPSKQLRNDVYARDDFACVYCGSMDDLTIDHKIPEIRGGSHDPENLQTACRKCNAQKRDLTDSEYRQRLCNGDVTLPKRPKSKITDTDIEPKGSCETGVSPVRPAEIVEAWNITAADLGLPRVVKLTADRKRKLSARCKDSTLEEFQAALAAIRRSRFLQGDNKDGWKANFDFFLQPKSFTKLIEGAYD